MPQQKVELLDRRDLGRQERQADRDEIADQPEVGATRRAPTHGTVAVGAVRTERPGVILDLLGRGPAAPLPDVRRAGTAPARDPGQGRQDQQQGRQDQALDEGRQQRDVAPLGERQPLAGATPQQLGQ